ncbi:hypothetical protein JXA80_01040 [bacterium]|nr:hypothetical protein [candidate division CSSED10-310 bacterium]
MNGMPGSHGNGLRMVFTLVTAGVLIGLLTVQGVMESAAKNMVPPGIRSKAYPGHDHDKDKDMANTVTVYPHLVGTILDDCRLCHCDGKRNDRYVNHCDFCHIVYPTEGYAVTLNAFGRDYATGGRNREALKAIETLDSDGDGQSNLAELDAGTQPGEFDSRRSMPSAPAVVFDRKKLEGIPRHSQFLLLNAHRVSDVYATYSGWTLYDLMKTVGALSKLEYITVISHDGFKKDYSGQDVFGLFPRGIFYGDMDKPAFLGKCPAWVEYPDVLPPGIETGKMIPDEQRLILADRKNGTSLATMHMNEAGKLVGEGPFRLILPPRRIAPPDQSMLTSTPTCPNPFDESIHHNSGDCARGVIAIGVYPLPEGTREPDWRARADELHQSGSIMIFGAIEVETPK